MKFSFGDCRKIMKAEKETLDIQQITPYEQQFASKRIFWVFLTYISKQLLVRSGDFPV